MYIPIIITVTWSNGSDHVELRSIRSNETRRVEFDLMIPAWQRDVIRFFGSSYCYNDKFIIYPFKCFNYKTIFLNQVNEVYLYMYNKAIF